MVYNLLLLIVWIQMFQGLGTKIKKYKKLFESIKSIR